MLGNQDKPMIALVCFTIALSYFDTIRFCKYLALLDERTELKFKIKNERLLVSLRCDHFGNALSDTTRHILNFSNYVLSDTKSFVLSNDLNCDLPLGYLSKEEIFAEFESLWAQLLHYSAASVDQRTGFKAGIGYLAHLHYDSTIDSRDFTVHKECFRAINSLRKNDFFFIFHIYPPFTRKRCIAMFWTVSLHSLGSCHIRVTCLPHKGGASR